VVARGPAAAGVRCPAPGHRLPLPGRRTGTPAPAPPQSWPTGTPSARQPLLNLASLLGLSITTTGDPTPAALAVGRLRRTAWFSGVRAAGNVEAEITLAPDRASLGDLEVDLKEYAADGLVQARRLRLADLALPGGSPERVTVALPTLGPGLKRQLRLYDRAGRLLDTCDAAAFLSQIKISMTGHAGEESTTQHVSVGQAPAATSPVTRLAALDTAEAGYTRLLTEGLSRRILDNPATALVAIQEAVEVAGMSC
jgi:hypothetical protein